MNIPIYNGLLLLTIYMGPRRLLRASWDSLLGSCCGGGTGTPGRANAVLLPRCKKIVPFWTHSSEYVMPCLSKRHSQPTRTQTSDDPTHCSARCCTTRCSPPPSHE